MAGKKKESTELAVIEVTEELLREKLYVIRGMKVMLDSDLAEIYGYETKNFNRQVKNNAEKFDSDEFMFQLTKKELDEILRCKNFTSSWGGSRHLPYVFTEQGVYMLMTVLKGDLAVKQSKDFVRTFKKMKDYILDNQPLIGQREAMRLSMQTAENTLEINRLRMDIGSIERQMSDVMDQLSEVVTKSDLSDMMNSFVTEEDNGWLFGGVPGKKDFHAAHLWYFP